MKKNNHLKGEEQWAGEIIKERLLGEGAYGQVFKGKVNKTGEIVAVKIIRVERDEEGISSTTLREISILMSLKHPNIIKLLGNMMVQRALDLEVHLIFEYMDEDLNKMLQRLQSIPLRQAKVQVLQMQDILRQILEGIHYMHQNGVFHRDLKPHNVLINADNVVKIGDFGLGRLVSPLFRTMSKEIETLWYRSPELLLGCQKYNLAVDVWSIGCIFYQLTENEVLFKTDSEIGQIMEIMRQCGNPKQEYWADVVKLQHFKHTFPKFPGIKRQYYRLEKDGIDLLERMIEINPNKRITIKEALDHQYFKQ